MMVSFHRSTFLVLFFLSVTFWIPPTTSARLSVSSTNSPPNSKKGSQALKTSTKSADPDFALKTLSKLNDRNSTSLCERINPADLPQECTCSEPGPYSLVIECLKPFNSTFFNDTIGMKIVILPCDPDGASVSIDVTERDHDIDYPISGIRAGEEKDYPIPGLAIIVPGLGHLGLDVAVMVTGNLDSLTLKIGLNACVALATKTVCASSIPGLNTILPWFVLSGTYKFSDICDESDSDENGTVRGWYYKRNDS